VKKWASLQDGEWLMSTKEGPYIGEITETQKGAIGEGVVATRLILESEGRLSPFTPIADDGGIDFLIHDKHTGVALPLQVKSRTKTIKRSPKIVHFQVREATFNEYENGYVLAVYFEPGGHEFAIGRAWLITMPEFRAVARQGSQNLVIRPSIDMKSRDKYTPYRCEGFTQVARRLTDRLDTRSQLG
jgi:hypothetical protein